MHQFVSLCEILQNINDYQWSDALYLPDEDKWTQNTKGVVLDPDDVDAEEDEIPKFALDNNLIYSLDIQTIQGIIDNANQQKKDCTIEDLFDAYLYYYNNDAFIVFNK